jgi:hypothetical protein
LTAVVVARDFQDSMVVVVVDDDNGILKIPRRMYEIVAVS